MRINCKLKYFGSYWICSFTKIKLKIMAGNLSGNFKNWVVFLKYDIEWSVERGVRWTYRRSSTQTQRFLARSTHVCIIHGGVNCLNSFPYRCYTLCIDHRHWFHWTAVWLQLHVSLVHVSACSFAVSQASYLALLVGYVA